MKNNKIIDKGLYREAFREIRIIGIVFAAVCMFITFGSVFSNFADAAVYELSQTIEAYQFLNPSLILIYIAAPLMTLAVFGWVNTRKAADFYHSLPYKRECIYISGMAAIMTWITATLFTSFAVSTVAYLIFPKMFAFSMYSVVTTFFGALASVFLTASAVSFAISLTGTRFMNIFVSLLVLFVPRVFIEVVINVFSSNSPVLVTSSFPVILSKNCNIVYAIIRNALSFYEGVYTIEPAYVIYTFVLGAVYFALAALLFKKRKSESAHRPSTTPVLQAVFRIVFAVFLIIVTFPFIIDGGFGIGSLIWYSIVAVLYFAIELITTKKWKNVLRSIPGLFIALVICVSVFFGSCASAALTLTFEPAADEIKSVRILSDTTHDYGLGGVSFKSWASEKASSVEIDDRTVAEIVANALKKSNELAASHSFVRDNNSDFVCFSIKTARGTTYRRIVMTNANMERILSIASEYEDYREKFTKLPESKNVSVKMDYNAETIELPNEVYETFCGEVLSKDFSQWNNFLQNEPDDSTIYIYAVVHEKRKTPVVLEIPVSPVIAPKTYEEIVRNYFYSEEKCRKFIENFEKIVDKLEENGIIEDGYSWMWGAIQLYFYDDGLENGITAYADTSVNFDKYYDEYAEYAVGDYDYDFKFGIDPTEVVELLKKEADSEFDMNSYLFIRVDGYPGDELWQYMSRGMSAYFPISEETEAYFREYAEEVQPGVQTYVRH